MAIYIVLLAVLLFGSQSSSPLAAGVRSLSIKTEAKMSYNRAFVFTLNKNPHLFFCYYCEYYYCAARDGYVK